LISQPSRHSHSDLDRRIVTVGSVFSAIFIAVFFYFAVLIFAGPCTVLLPSLFPSLACSPLLAWSASTRVLLACLPAAVCFAPLFTRLPSPPFDTAPLLLAHN
jgi:hypothetical protein